MVTKYGPARSATPVAATLGMLPAMGFFVLVVVLSVVSKPNWFDSSWPHHHANLGGASSTDRSGHAFRSALEGE